MFNLVTNFSFAIVIKAETWAEMIERSKKEGLDIVDKFEKKLQANNIEGSVQFELSGKPGEYLMEEADKLNASMIVMGTRGYGMVRRTILGSVSNYVVHHSKVPVTVVPPETQSWFF